MESRNLDRDWEFMKGEPSHIPMMPKETKTVNLPHDFMIETEVRADSVNGANTGYFDGGTATYTKYLEIPEELAGKRILAEFDGVFGITEVILNGHVMGRHHYGYTPFTVDLTDRINPGKRNRLAVVVSTAAQQNSRWYSGAGIYRHVKLLVGPKVHIAPCGIYAYTSHILGENAFVIVETRVENHTDAPRDLWVELQFQGLLETGARELAVEEECAARGWVKVHVPAGESAVARTQVTVENARIWDIDAPNLYRVTAFLRTQRPEGRPVCDAASLDSASVNFGIRTLSVDAKNGLVLNGRRVKLKGGCIHHDNGILGAASFRDSELRKAALHKDNGYNALRFAHNPASSDMLDACDRLGLLVIDEAFDTWNMSKNYFDFSQYFEAEWEQELTSFLLRDRNHPSVAIWSIGNELPEQGGLSDGYETSAKLAAHVRSLDATRPVAGALCSFFRGLDDEDTARFWQSVMEEAQANGGNVVNVDGKFGREIWNDYTECFAAPWDVVGYNYLNYHYEEAGELFPDRVICATESKPGEMEAYWADVEKYPYVIGDFEWTSHDYIGEAGIGKRLYVKPEEAAAAGRMIHYAGYPWRTAGAGEFDLCGFDKPQLAYRRIIWGSRETYLVSHNPANHDKIEILDRYAWPDCAHAWSWPVETGSPVKVEVYSAGEEVELFLNGRSQGRRPAGKGNHYRAVFELRYEPGTLEAVSYRGGLEWSRDQVTSAGPAAGLRILPEAFSVKHPELPGDGQSLYFARVEVVDAVGNPVPYGEVEVQAEVHGEVRRKSDGDFSTEACGEAALAESGDGLAVFGAANEYPWHEAVEAEACATLAAFGSARPATTENYTVGKTVTYQGRALAILRAGHTAGEAVLAVKAEGLGEARIAVKVG